MKKNNKLLVIIFGIVLLSPVIFGYFGIGKNLTLNENREVASLPKIALYKEFPSLYTKYFSDNFGLRGALIVADRWWRFKLFGVSPNKAITIGKEKWLFYTPDINYIDSVNAQGFSHGELEQIKNNLLATQNEFKKRGMSFYFLVAPNKQSVYPEYLPDYMKKVRADSRLDQLSNFLEKEINFINPKKELMESKNKSPVYLKYDTHWNENGAWVAYEKLIKKIGQDFKSVKTKEINNFEINLEKAPNNDLAIQMGVPGNFVEKEKIFEDKNQKAKSVFEDCPKIYTGCPLVIKEIPNSKLPKLLMFRDSFGATLIPLISENFQRSYFYWGAIPYSGEIIKKEKPEIVVMELTERELWRLKDKLFEF